MKSSGRDGHDEANGRRQRPRHSRRLAWMRQRPAPAVSLARRCGRALGAWSRHHQATARLLLRVGRLLGIALVAGVAAVALLGAGPVSRAEIGPGTVELRARWSTAARTELQLPPFGSISARTHRAPIGFGLQVEEVDVEAVQRLLAREEPAETLRRQAEDELGGLIRNFALRAVGLAAVIGALVGLVLPRRRWSFVVAGALGAVAAVATLLGAAWSGYHPDAFANARFEGPIERAPALFGTVRQYVNDFGQVQDRVEALASQITDLYATSTTESIVEGPGRTHVLHVSDIHLNPIGLEVTRELAGQFGVDAILDTGDLTTFGFPLEARFGDLIGSMPAPYYLVPGNHDAPSVRASLAQVSNVSVLDGDVVDIGGLRIAGVAHPSFTASNELSPSEVEQDLADQAVPLRTLVRRTHPDVLAVHDPRQAQVVLGEVPVVAAGHVHETTARTEDGTLVLTVGSTGATGLGSFTVNADLSYAAEVLSFDATGGLVSIDTVTLRGTEGEFRIERRLIRPER